MNELLSISIGIGLVCGFIFTEFFGLACGGLVVPGYIALYMTQPLHLLLTFSIAFLALLMVRIISLFTIIYGRRRSAAMILAAYLLGMIFREQSIILAGEAAAVIGFIIPGLIAIWMERQGIWQTLASLLTVSVIVRLILILTIGME